MAKTYARVRQSACMPFEIIIVRPADTVLKEAIEKDNWFEGVALSTVYLESSASAHTYSIDFLLR